MIRPVFAVLSLGLLTAGCVGVPCADNPAMTCYAPAPVQPAVAAPAPAYVGEDGLTYVDGYPVDYVDGQQVYLSFVPALGWGFYDAGGRFRRAPPGMVGRLERFHPGGRGLPPGGPRGFVPGGGRPFAGARPGIGAPPGAGGPPGRPVFGGPRPGPYAGGPGPGSGLPQGVPGGRPVPAAIVRPGPAVQQQQQRPQAAARPAPPPHQCAPGQRIC